jgi:hypothetical protein
MDKLAGFYLGGDLRRIQNHPPAVLRDSLVRDDFGGNLNHEIPF